MRRIDMGAVYPGIGRGETIRWRKFDSAMLQIFAPGRETGANDVVKAAAPGAKTDLPIWRPPFP
jgi:hypothetical protein